MKKLLLPFLACMAFEASAQGGETCASAQTISSLPFTNTGNTSTAVDNYFASCADASNNGGAKDVVYKYTTGSTAQYVDISLCLAVTNYDSQLYVFESTCSGTPYACMEDGCESPAFSDPYNSTLENILLNPSTTYYIVVDGFDGGSNGNFQLNVTAGAGPATAAIPFIDATTSLPSVSLHSGNAVGVADMNNDGLDDIVRTNNNSTMVIDFQQVGGTFTETAYTGVTIGDPWAMTIADVNNDGYNDVMYGDVSTTYILTSNMATSFTSLNVSSVTGAGSIFVQGANFFDVNNDGDLDAFVCNDVAMSHIYVGNGAGSWDFDQSLIPLATVPSSDNSGNYASIWSDINNDDLQDLFITHCRQSVGSSTDPRRIDQIFLNGPGNVFTQDVTNFTGLRSGAQGWSTDFADFDNDGDMDCFILNYDVNSQLMLNNGSGVFTNITGASGIDPTTSFFGMNVVCEDFNNDGFIDIFMSGTEHHMYINNGDLTFTEDEGGLVYSTYNITSNAVGDLNHDGKLDIFASYCNVYNDPSSRDDKLFLNNVSNGNHFISFDMNGVASNKGGIGTKVKIYGPWGVQVREIRSGEAYGICNSLSAHFGLGSATTVDSVVIIWPSGTLDSYVNLAADQWITVDEGNHPVNTAKLPAKTDVKLYPNPTTGMFTMDIAVEGQATVSLRDISGRVVYSTTVNQRMNTIDIRGFENGVYTYEVSTASGKTSGKLVKQ